jgi:hypothetical protein
LTLTDFIDFSTIAINHNNRFGVFIVLNVMYSTIFAFGLFATVLVLWGPVHGRNDFYWIFLFVQGKDTSAAYSVQGQEPGDGSDLADDVMPRSFRAISPAIMNSTIDESPRKSTARTSTDPLTGKPNQVTSL